MYGMTFGCQSQYFEMYVAMCDWVKKFFYRIFTPAYPQILNTIWNLPEMCFHTATTHSHACFCVVIGMEDRLQAIFMPRSRSCWFPNNFLSDKGKQYQAKSTHPNIDAHKKASRAVEKQFTLKTVFQMLFYGIKKFASKNTYLLQS